MIFNLSWEAMVVPYAPEFQKCTDNCMAFPYYSLCETPLFAFISHDPPSFYFPPFSAIRQLSPRKDQGQ